jgi:hypothetical protein
MEFEGNTTRLNDQERHNLGKTIAADVLEKLGIDRDNRVYTTRFHAMLRDHYPIIEQAPVHVQEMLIQLEAEEPELE